MLSTSVLLCVVAALICLKSTQQKYLWFDCCPVRPALYFLENFCAFANWTMKFLRYSYWSQQHFCYCHYDIDCFYILSLQLFVWGITSYFSKGTGILFLWCSTVLVCQYRLFIGHDYCHSSSFTCSPQSFFGLVLFFIDFAFLVLTVLLYCLIGGCSLCKSSYHWCRRNPVQVVIHFF